MAQSIEIRCGNCATRFSIQGGEMGGVYACPTCGTRNRASRRAIPAWRSGGSSSWKKPLLFFLACGAIGAVLECSCLRDDRDVSSSQAQLINAAAFMEIANAHGERFRESASKTRTALARMEQLIAATQGNPKLDPRIRHFAEMQAEYELAFSRYVATEREAFEHPAKVPMNLGKMQQRYHRKARDLCRVYAPDWASGLDVRIAEDDEIIRRLREKE